MGEQTKIEWCDATFNPWTGCQKVSAGCDHCFAETLGMRAVVRDGWKYIWHIQGKDELYDLNRDPMEMLNRLDEEPGRVAALRAELFEWVTANLGKRPDAMALQLARIEAVRGKPVPYL